MFATRLPRICYFCGAPATSDDHVPPKVFFPEDKDLPTGVTSQRVNLTTVPSCDTHNNAFSLDDEYAAYVVCHSLENNATGAIGVHQKAVRAAVRNQSKAFITRRAAPVIIDNQYLMSHEPEVERLNSTFRRIARGLYFLETQGRILREPLFVACIDMRHRATLRRDPLFEQISELSRKFGDLFTDGVCPNPESFKYKYAFPGADKAIFLLQFYEGFEVHVASAIGPRAIRDNQIPGHGDDGSVEVH